MSYVVDSVFAGGDHTMTLVEGLSSTNNTNGLATQAPNVTIRDYRHFGGQNQILTVTNENISQICSAVEPVNQDLMTIAETIFASPAIWNASFLKANGDHVPSTYKNMGVDLVQVIYHLLTYY